MTAAYYPDHKPRDATKFGAMAKMFGTAKSTDHLRQLMMLYFMDPSYDREDLLVALGRVEREKGWKL